MKKLIYYLLLLSLIIPVNLKAQNYFNQVLAEVGFSNLRPNLYEFRFDVNEKMYPKQVAKISTGLFLGFKVELFKIGKNISFVPGVYYDLVFAEDTAEDLDLPGDGIIEASYSLIEYSVSDISANGDFYYRIRTASRDYFLGAGIGIHSVDHKTTFIMDPKFAPTGPLDNYIDTDVFDPGDIYDNGETKVAVNIIAKMDMGEKITFEGKLELMSEFSQFRFGLSYKLWERKEQE